MGSGTNRGFLSFQESIMKKNTRKSKQTRLIVQKTQFKHNPKVIKEHTGIEVKEGKVITILFAHDNRKGYYTTRVHKFAELIGNHPGFKRKVDYETWKRGEKPSFSENNRRERELVKASDIIVRFIPPASKSGPRNDGAPREVRKGINFSSPVLEIYMSGAHDSPNRPIREKNYSKRVSVHLKQGECMLKGFKVGLKKMMEQNIISHDISFTK